MSSPDIWMDELPLPQQHQVLPGLAVEIEILFVDIFWQVLMANYFQCHRSTRHNPDLFIKQLIEKQNQGVIPGVLWV